MGASPMPNSITATGIQDRGETMRRNWKAPLVASSSFCEAPMASPRGMPKTSAQNRPTATRRRLTRVCTVNWLSRTRWTRLGKALIGENRPAMAVSSPTRPMPAAQSNSRTSSPPRLRARRLWAGRGVVRGFMGSVSVRPGLGDRECFRARVAAGHAEVFQAALGFDGLAHVAVVHEVARDERGIQVLQEGVLAQHEGVLEQLHQFLGVAGEGVGLEVDALLVPVGMPDRAGARVFGIPLGRGQQDSRQ